MSKYVQHRSGDGEKWEVLTKWEDGFNARISGRVYYLPSSEYIECLPPEEWEDVSKDCRVDHACMFKPGESDQRLSILHKIDAIKSIDIFHPCNKDKYRIASMVVERRKP